MFCLDVGMFSILCSDDFASINFVKKSKLFFKFSIHFSNCYQWGLDNFLYGCQSGDGPSSLWQKKIYLPWFLFHVFNFLLSHCFRRIKPHSFTYCLYWFKNFCYCLFHGKLVIIQILYPYSAQIYETLVRSQALGFFSVCGRLATTFLGMIGISSL